MVCPFLFQDTDFLFKTPHTLQKTTASALAFVLSDLLQDHIYDGGTWWGESSIVSYLRPFDPFDPCDNNSDRCFCLVVIFLVCILVGTNETHFFRKGG
jgi:hypothetical protein